MTEKGPNRSNNDPMKNRQKGRESRHKKGLTVRFLETSTSTWTTEDLGLTASVIGDKKSAIVLSEGLLQLVLGVLIDKLLVVGDKRLGDGLSDGVDLGNTTTTGDADADVDIGEFVESNDQQRFVDLEGEV